MPDEDNNLDGSLLWILENDDIMCNPRIDLQQIALPILCTTLLQYTTLVVMEWQTHNPGHKLLGPLLHAKTHDFNQYALDFLGKDEQKQV